MTNDSCTYCARSHSVAGALCLSLGPAAFLEFQQPINGTPNLRPGSLTWASPLWLHVTNLRTTLVANARLIILQEGIQITGTTVVQATTILQFGQLLYAGTTCLRLTVSSDCPSLVAYTRSSVGTCHDKRAVLWKGDPPS
jgi:hypothetical protein